MTRHLVIYGGSFNPPGVHHQAAARALASRFDEVHVIPCGPRPDKPSTNALPPVFRAAIADLAFRSIPKVIVDLSDLELDQFTTSVDLEARFAAEAEVWHAVPAELIADGAIGRSIIQRVWKDGPKMWQRSRFAVFRGPGHPARDADLPPHAIWIDVPVEGSSQDLRRRLFEGHSCIEELDPRVRAYLRRYDIYSLAPPRAVADLSDIEPRFRILTADFNPKATTWREELAQFAVESDPQALLVIGGDGTMLRAIQAHWRERLPYLGLNAGHLGFLMNERSELFDGDGRFADHLTLRRLPMLRVRFQRRDGSWIEDLSFNDAWLERSTGQTAWLRVDLNGETRIDKLVCDGALVSTAAGSTAYALSMGAAPLLADTPAWLLVGSNVMRPLGWKSAILPMDATIRIESLDPVRRPLHGYSSGQLIPDVVSMEARMSRTASVELAFHAKRDLARKISDLQFGSVRPF